MNKFVNHELLGYWHAECGVTRTRLRREGAISSETVQHSDRSVVLAKRVGPGVRGDLGRRSYNVIYPERAGLRQRHVGRAVCR